MTMIMIMLILTIMIMIMIMIIILIPTACAVGWLKRKRHAADLVHLYRVYPAVARPSVLLTSKLC